MAIKYDGAVFESVDELVAYKKAMEQPDKKVVMEQVEKKFVDDKRQQEQKDTTKVEKSKFFNRNKRFWKNEELETLKSYYDKYTDSNGKLKKSAMLELSNKLGRTKSAIKKKKWEIDICIAKPTKVNTNPFKISQSKKTGHGSHWSDAEIELMKDFYSKHTTPTGMIKRYALNKLVKKLGRTKDAIKKKRVDLMKDGKLQVYKNTEPVTKSTGKKTYPKGRADWSAEDVKILESYVQKYKSEEGKLPRDTVISLAKIFDRTEKSVYQRMNIIRKNLGFYTSRKVQTMLRKKPITPQPYDKRMVDIANKGISKSEPFTRPSIKLSDLEFPQICPLAKESVKIFEQMLIDMIGRKGKISYFDAKNNLMLEGGKEWNYGEWNKFLSEFALSLNKISTALLIPKEKFAVKIENGYNVIAYNR